MQSPKNPLHKALKRTETWVIWAEGFLLIIWLLMVPSSYLFHKDIKGVEYLVALVVGGYFVAVGRYRFLTRRLLKESTYLDIPPLFDSLSCLKYKEKRLQSTIRHTLIPLLEGLTPEQVEEISHLKPEHLSVVLNTSYQSR